jgi:protein-disulfide isomerase-like protein with CxxC motif
MDRMTKAKRLPALPKGVVKPAIVTGLEALGRGHDLNKYLTMLKALQPLGPELLAQYLNAGDFISRVATSLGIDSAGMIKSQEEMQAEQQQAQQAQQMQMMGELAGKAAPSMIKGLSDKASRTDEAAMAAQAPEAAPQQ